MSNCFCSTSVMSNSSIGNLCLLFIVSVIHFSSYCEAWGPFTCGSGLQFSYPFGTRNGFCGDPLLQVQCDTNNNMPLLDINHTQYYILNYTNFSSSALEGIVMTIIDKNLTECDASLSNSSMQFWSSHQLHIVDGYKNITLWEGCPNDTRDFLLKPSKSRCSRSFHYITSSNMSRTRKCKSQFQVPVRKDFHPGGNLHPNIIEGFNIKWLPSNSCKSCMLDKGICASKPINITCISDKGTCTDKASNPFICMHWGNDWDHAGKSSNSKAVLRGCSITGSIAVAVCVLVFFIYHVKRRRAQPIQSVHGINKFNERTDISAALGNLPIFTYEELQQATNRFHENNELGNGGFGTVYLGNLRDGRMVAVKRLYQQNSKRIEQFINEVKILSSLHHPNLVQLYGCSCAQSPALLLVYEFIPNGTLSDHLHGSRKTPKGLSWEIRLNIALETAQALSFLHSVNPPIFHRDVKSTNILLDENYRTKVADFGLSRLVPVNVSHVTTLPQGSPGYLDPEYHQCFQLTEKSDVYSFGVVLMELISAKLAVDTRRNRNEVSLANMAIEKIRTGALHELVDPDLKAETNHEVKAMVFAVSELAFGCLARDSDLRPDMKEVSERLEEIRLRYERSNSSISEDHSYKMPISATLVPEEWPSRASDNTV